jgi:hypothetical protein
MGKKDGMGFAGLYHLKKPMTTGFVNRVLRQPLPTLNNSNGNFIMAVVL